MLQLWFLTSFVFTCTLVFIWFQLNLERECLTGSRATDLLQMECSNFSLLGQNSTCISDFSVYCFCPAPGGEKSCRTDSWQNKWFFLYAGHVWFLGNHKFPSPLSCPAAVWKRKWDQGRIRTIAGWCFFTDDSPTPGPGPGPGCQKIQTHADKPETQVPVLPEQMSRFWLWRRAGAVSRSKHAKPTPASPTSEPKVSLGSFDQTTTKSLFSLRSISSYATQRCLLLVYLAHLVSYVGPDRAHRHPPVRRTHCSVFSHGVFVYAQQRARADAECVL